jgi:AraC family transcriptional regulator, melibiose operon regulatory protein
MIKVHLPSLIQTISVFFSKLPTIFLSPWFMDTFRLRVWQGEVMMVAEPHRHHELELNLVFNGSMTYLFGGQSVTVNAGQLTLFWGTLLRHLRACEAQTRCDWLTLPLATFLRYGLPDKLTQLILHGPPVIEAVTEVDTALYARWLEDCQRQDRERLEVISIYCLAVFCEE